MDRRKRTARTVALMSLFTMTDTQTDVPIASFDGDGSDLNSLIVGIEPVQAGSGDPSPDNIRPITGWTGATVTRTGINVWDEETESGRISAIGKPSVDASFIRTKNFISIKPNTGYYRHSPNNIQLFWYDAEQNFLSYANWGKGSITSPSNAYYVKFHVDPSYGTIYNHDISINYPSTDTAYHAYQGNTYSITFPTSAGTVYGGTLDVTAGKLTVDRANIASYNGEPLPSTWISDRDVYAVGTTPTTGAQVVYELAAPIVYDLTPTEINTLLGTNNIWADTGEIKYIEYNV